MTERVNITNLIMQGTAFGSLICTIVIDKLAKIFYSGSKLLYNYKGEVEVPISGMVDDVLNVATIDSFIEHNKLKINPSKCSIVHVEKKQIAAMN